MHEGTWATDWRSAEDIILDKPRTDSKNADIVPKSKKGDWFCRAFNSVAGCELESGHEAMINKRKRKVKHMCAKCYINDGTISHHAQTSSECPLN